ncbi:MAG: hypothetical protein WA667_12770 [Candidatus Nitrosopolaris sp.]
MTSALCFGTLVPHPTAPEFDVPLDYVVETVYKILYGSDAVLQADLLVGASEHKTRAGLFDEFVKDNPGARARAEQYRANVARYGYTCQARCRMDKWGTPDEIEDAEEHQLLMERRSPNAVEYYFNTYWGTPDRWSRAVSRLFPDLTVSLRWEAPDEDLTGLVVFKNGRRLKSIERPVWQIPGDDYSLYCSYVTEPEGPPRVVKAASRPTSKRPQSRSEMGRRSSASLKSKKTRQ